MKTIQITEENAEKAITAAEHGAEAKEILTIMFGKTTKPQPPIDIRERIKSFEDACEFTNTDPNQDKFQKGDKDSIAYEKLKVITKALNEGWIPDWGNDSQYKYQPYFVMNNSGVGFSYSYCDYWITTSIVGSRLCFKTRELCQYAQEQFKDLYSDLHSI